MCTINFEAEAPSIPKTVTTCPESSVAYADEPPRQEPEICMLLHAEQNGSGSSTGSNDFLQYLLPYFQKSLSIVVFFAADAANVYHSGQSEKDKPVRMAAL